MPGRRQAIRQAVRRSLGRRFTGEPGRWFAEED
jgi:hypothetical protein